MPTLRPLKQYDERDVINLYAFSGTLPVNKGTVVKIQGDGWKNTDELARLGAVGASYGNTVSERYGVAAKVASAGSGDAVLGILLHDVKETDENGEKLVFNPRKAAEMCVAISGQAVPVLTKGIVLYSGSVLAADDPAAGAAVYSNNAGELTTTNGGGTKVGIALGKKDANNHVLIKINL
jgi:predicted RecA/RadA family phage recombinase